jgi:hypothetical protein
MWLLDSTSQDAETFVLFISVTSSASDHKVVAVVRFHCHIRRHASARGILYVCNRNLVLLLCGTRLIEPQPQRIRTTLSPALKDIIAPVRTICCDRSECR